MSDTLLVLYIGKIIGIILGVIGLGLIISGLNTILLSHKQILNRNKIREDYGSFFRAIHLNEPQIKDRNHHKLSLHEIEEMSQQIVVEERVVGVAYMIIGFVTLLPAYFFVSKI